MHLKPLQLIVILNNCSGNEEMENNDTEEDYSSDDSTKFETVIDTHKLQELIKGTTINVPGNVHT